MTEKKSLDGKTFVWHGGVKRLLLAISLGLPAVPLFGAYETNTWCGAGADNNWTTKANWTQDFVPGGWQFVRIPSGDWTINIPSESRTIGFTLEDGTGTVTLTGNDSRLNFSDYDKCLFEIPEGRTLILDGVNVTNAMTIRQGGNVYLKNGDMIFKDPSKSLTRVIDGNAKLHIINGQFSSNGTQPWLCVSNNAEVVVFENGKYYAGTDFYCDSSRLVIAGGEYRIGNAYYTRHVYETPNISFLGGRVVWMSSGSDGHDPRMRAGDFSRFAPHRGAVLIHPSVFKNSLIFFPSGTSVFSGDVYTTNRATEVSGGISISDGWANVGGGGTIYANRISLNDSSATRQQFDLGGLYLGNGGVQKTSTSGTPSFVNGLTLGAFEDLALFTNSGWTASFVGPLAIKTANCFEEEDEGTGETKRHLIHAENLDLSGVSNLSADGGGSVELINGSGKYPEQLRTIEVADGTALAFTNCQARLKTMNLKMGANSRLLIDLSQGAYVDVAAVAEFGAGAKIVVTALPESLSSGTLYPIYAGPAKKDDDSSADIPQIVLPADVPEGWLLEYRAGCAYLSDGVVSPKFSGEKTWHGTSDGFWTNKANWADESVPSVRADAVHFTATSHSVVTNTVTSGLSHPAGNMSVMVDAPPYVFRGDEFVFRFPYNSTVAWTVGYYSVRSDSAFPVVFDCDIASGGDNESTPQLSIRMLVIEQGSISMLGDTDMQIPLEFGGDVRVGGNVRASTVNCVRNYGSAIAKRRSRLTVMPGATLTATDQAGELGLSLYFAVAKGGTMTVNGTQFLFTMNANTHYVDGTMTINAPFGATKTQTFLGDGRLKLAGGFMSGEEYAGGIVLEGKLTLVPANWSAKFPISFRGDITVEAESDWTYSSETNLVLEAHSALTFATGGHSMKILSPIISEGDVAVKGGGRLVLGAPGTRLYSLSCSEGACVDFSNDMLDANRGEDGYSDVLALRNREGLVFAENLKIKERYDVYSHSYIYSACRKRGTVVILK